MKRINPALNLERETTSIGTYRTPKCPVLCRHSKSRMHGIHTMSIQLQLRP